MAGILGSPDPRARPAPWRRSASTVALPVGVLPHRRRNLHLDTHFALSLRSVAPSCTDTPDKPRITQGPRTTDPERAARAGPHVRMPADTCHDQPSQIGRPGPAATPPRGAAPGQAPSGSAYGEPVGPSVQREDAEAETFGLPTSSMVGPVHQEHAAADQDERIDGRRRTASRGLRPARGLVTSAGPVHRLRGPSLVVVRIIGDVGSFLPQASQYPAVARASLSSVAEQTLHRAMSLPPSGASQTSLSRPEESRQNSDERG